MGTVREKDTWDRFFFWHALTPKYMERATAVNKIIDPTDKPAIIEDDNTRDEPSTQRLFLR